MTVWAAPDKYFFPAMRRDATTREKPLRNGKWPPDLFLRKEESKMPGTKIQWGQVAVVLSIVVLSWWAATQWTAWELGFQPELGRPWFVLFHHWSVYAPPLFFWWWFEFDAYAPNVFARGAWMAGSGGGGDAAEFPPVAGAAEFSPTV